jgi:hypothetical protein
MWAEITRHLYEFESAVLAGLDEEGYPFSVRFRPYPDASGAEVLKVWLPPGTPVRPGPASLLCHSHDENLWNLKSFLVRGVLVKDAGGWSFEPGQFIPGIGVGGLPAMIRFFFSSRRKTSRYLQKRNLARPSIPWDEINAAKRVVSYEPSARKQKQTAHSYSPLD